LQIEVESACFKVLQALGLVPLEHAALMYAVNVWEQVSRSHEQLYEWLDA
jgi:hypothetical protein